MDKEISKTKSNIPVTKIWCVPHRSNLAFDDLCKNNGCLDKIFRILTSIASYFHTSAIRTNTLKEIANKLNLKLLTMPKLFEIRWVEYTFQLVKAILSNWHAIALYCNENCDAQTNGFRLFLCDMNNLRLISFSADLLYIFKRFQKQLQSNSLTLPSFCLIVRNLISLISSLENEKLKGGFESKLCDAIKVEDGKYFLKNIELSQKSQTSRRPTPAIENVRKDIIASLNGFITSRLQVPNSVLLNSIEHFLKFDKTVDITKIHESFGKDLELSLLSMQYHDLSNTPDDIKGKSLQDLIHYLVIGDRLNYFKEIGIVLARIFACTPHAADCERTISANNLLKTNRRMCLTISTENYYLYVHFNMSQLEEWDPRSAVNKFLNDSNRRISNVTKTTTEQPYFKHIFVKAAKMDETEDEDSFDQDFNTNLQF